MEKENRIPIGTGINNILLIKKLYGVAVRPTAVGRLRARQYITLYYTNIDDEYIIIIFYKPPKKGPFILYKISI